MPTRNRRTVLRQERGSRPSILPSGLLCLLFFFVSSIASAQLAQAGGSETYLWRPVAIGGGGFITGYSADRSGGTRVARADVYGAYLWLSEENRWTQLVTTSSLPRDLHAQNLANEGVYEIVVAPSNANRIYMALKGAVYRSDSRGATFARTAPLTVQPLTFDPNSEFRNYGPFIAVDPVNPDVVFFGTPANGLFRSENGGGSWQKVSSVPDSMDLRPEPGVQSPGAIIWFAPAADQRVSRIWTMSPGNGLYVSEDGGKNFSHLPNSSAVQPLTLKQGDFTSDGVFFGVDPDTQAVWRYRNGTWSNLTGESGLPASRFAAVAVQQQSSEIFVFDDGGRPYRSNNRGDTWARLLHRSQVGGGDPPWLSVSNQSYFAIGRVRFDPVVPSRLWVGAGTGVYYADITANALQVSWISQTRGIEELVANDVIKAPGRAPLFAAWDFGIHVKDDLNTFSSSYGPKERVLIAAQQLAWTPANPAFVATNASDTRTFCCSEDGDAVLAGFSTDGGRRWSKFATLPQPPGTKPDDPWRMSFGGLAVSADSTDNIVWVPSFNRSPYFTKDRGASWNRVVLPGEQLPFTGSHSAYYEQRKTIAADRVQPGVFYWMHSGDGANAARAGLWMTRDGGAAWTRRFSGDISPESQHAAKLRAVPGQAGHLFFTPGVYGPVDTGLKRSRDGGATWTRVNDTEWVDDVAFGKPAAGSTYPTVFISGKVRGVYGIWRSTDDAGTWHRVGDFPLGSLDQVTVIEGDPDIFGRLYVGYKGSGWIYGEPNPCRAAPYDFPAQNECTAVR